ncbi:MAG: DUF3237 family protein [Deltaproteobacteria bacterium]|nr:DUF3237 family protein [Deltaproteobacteria bacterium]
MTFTLDLGEIHDVGTTHLGDRRIIDINGGTLSGDKIQATIDKGSLDLELTLSNGNMELEQVIVMHAGGTPIFLRVCGVAAAGDSVVRIVPGFEAPNSSAEAWVNTGKWVGTRELDESGGKMILKIYDVSGASAGSEKVQLKDPDGVENQDWECFKLSGSKGEEMFSESVSLGGSVSIGQSTNGSRNIIPITGGTVTGKIQGKVLNGGADYQLDSGSGTVLDARYTLQANDGEYILVRNCGPFGALVPVFETKADGAYNYLNEKVYLSSDPGGGAGGGVGLTFYKKN